MENISVLILDDDEFILEVVQAMLSGLNIVTVHACSSGSQALASLTMDNPLQVVLCDLNMPGMDGIQFIRHLVQCQYAGGIIVLSGEDPRTLQTVENLVRAHQLRLLGVLQKPVDRQSLLNLLDRIRPVTSTGQQPEFCLTEADLREGLAGDALVPFFQPQIEIATRKVIGVEALARWRHPEHGLLGPGAFIALAERIGLISELTDRMLAESLRQCRSWRDAGFDLTLSVNVSMDCLSRIPFPEQVLNEAESSGVPIDRLMLEITESRLMQDTVASLDVLSRLCLKRVKLSIDDYGTAYSNLEKLQMLPFAELKIDRSFVHGAANNASVRTILESSTLLGKRLGMQVIAEGVETQGDWDCAAAAGCDLIQGFLVARPMPKDELVDWLQRWE